MAQWIQALALRVDPAWRRRPDDERREGADAFLGAVRDGRVTTYCYSTLGLEADSDLMLWRMAGDPDDLQRAGAEQLAAGAGRWLDVTHSFVGVIQPSPYVRRALPEVPALFDGERRRYLIVYPFTKTAEWYRLSGEDRRRLMGEHIRIGHAHPEVRQLLANSFGMDDADFVVAYETDDAAGFSALVHELRGTAARVHTAADTPLLAGIHRTPAHLADLLGGVA